MKMKLGKVLDEREKILENVICGDRFLGSPLFFLPILCIQFLRKPGYLQRERLPFNAYQLRAIYILSNNP
jgi:hypothetical protein